MIIDAHAHIFEKIDSFTGNGELKSLEFGKILKGTGEIFRLLPPSFIEISFTPETLLEYMDWVGVEKAILLQGTLYGFHNRYVANAVKKWPDRFIGCAMIDPLSKNSLKVLKYLVEELGFRGLKFECSETYGWAGIHPEIQLDSPEWKVIFEEAAKYKLPVIFDLGRPGTRGYQVKSLKKLIHSFPEVNVVICHLGFPFPGIETNPDLYSSWQELVLLGKNKNVWIDIAALPAIFNNRDYPYPEAQKYLKLAYQITGAERYLWGSDIPGILAHVTYKQCLDFIRNHCDFFTPEEKKGILGQNATRLFQM